MCVWFSVCMQMCEWMCVNVWMCQCVNVCAGIGKIFAILMKQGCGFNLSNTLRTTSRSWYFLTTKTQVGRLQICPSKSSRAAGNTVQKFPVSIQMKIA